MSHKMQWSKLKHHIESLFAESVKGRVGLHSTRYRTMHDSDGRSWITLDGKEIINMVYWWKWDLERWKREQILTREADVNDQQNPDESQKRLTREAKKSLASDSFFWQGNLGEALHQYLSLSIDEIVYSSNVIIRALGMLDARFGRRRLKAMDVSNEPELVKTLYAFRCHVEGVLITSHCEPHRIKPALENYESEREKIFRKFRETANEKLVHSKKTRKLPNLIRSISEGTISEEDSTRPFPRLFIEDIMKRQTGKT